MYQVSVTLIKSFGSDKLIKIYLLDEVWILKRFPFGCFSEGLCNSFFSFFLFFLLKYRIDANRSLYE